MRLTLRPPLLAQTTNAMIADSTAASIAPAEMMSAAVALIFAPIAISTAAFAASLALGAPSACPACATLVRSSSFLF
jgi:hypothetical protein